MPPVGNTGPLAPPRFWASVAGRSAPSASVGNTGPLSPPRFWASVAGRNTSSTAVGLTATVSWHVYGKTAKSARVIWDVQATSPSTDVVYDDGRCGPFSAVTVDYMVEGTSRVSWTVRPDYPLAAPVTYQLQSGNTGTQTADDWVDVGGELTDTFMAIDQTRRAFGKQLTVHYRIKAVDANGVTYFSQTANVLGSWTVHDMIIAREIIRKWRLRNKNFAGVTGYLLKRRRDGGPCTRCLDPFTNEVLEGNCPVCLGVRYLMGYYKPVPGSYSVMDNDTITEQRTSGPEGWSLPTAVTAMFLGNPLLSTGDLWVNAGSDIRYHMQTINIKAQIRGVPVLSQVVLRALPFSDIAYKIQLEGTL